MIVIDDFSQKKIYHNLMELNKYKDILFVLPDISSLKAFDPILEHLKIKFLQYTLYSGLIETLKNRGSNIGDYIFINLLNKDKLKNYDVILKLPEIFDYGYFLPNIVGITNIPNIRMDEKFNFVLDYYKIKKFILFNVTKDIDIKKSAEYIDHMMENDVNIILIGDNITCAELVNITKYNPIIIYRSNKPLISDLIKKCEYVVGKMKPRMDGIMYSFMDIDEEIKIFESMK